MKRFFSELNEVLFGWGSPNAMAVFRILFGLVHLANWAIIGQHFEYWYTEKGLVPSDIALRFNGEAWRFNPLASTPDNLNMFWFGWMILCALLVTVGLFTRVAAIMLALLTVAFHLRNPILLHGGDTLLRNMTILLALAPAGAAYSVDAWLRKKNGLPAVTEVSMWPQRMMQFQLALVYVTTVIQKVAGETWRNGTATWFPPQLDEFKRFPVPAFFDTQPFIMISTYGTLVLELALGTLVFWRPARRYVVLGGLFLHAAIEYRFNIPLFAFTICACYVNYYNGEEVAGFLAKVQNRFLVKHEKPA